MRIALVFALLCAPALASADAEIIYESKNSYGSLLKVVAPEGATCKVKRGMLGQKHTVPFTVKAEAHMFYSFECSLPGGGTWAKKVEARPQQIGVIRIAAQAQAAQTGGSSGGSVNEAPASAAPAPAAPQPMTAAAFDGLVAAVAGASFSSDKINVVRAAAGKNRFTIAQLGDLMDQCAHSSDKVKVAEMIAPRVVDPQNAFQLGARLSFSSDKEKVLGLFR